MPGRRGPPLLAYLVGRTERRRVVHDRASAETRAGEDPHRLVARGRRCVAEVASVAPKLGAVEIPIVVVVAGLEHDDVEARGGQTSSGRPAAGARSDDAHVALELGSRVTASGSIAFGGASSTGPIGPG